MTHAMIPTLMLNNGVEIPVIGNGPATPGYSPKYKYERSRVHSLIYRAYDKFVGRPLINKKWVDAVASSFQVGYTLLDNSAAYRNDQLIYKALSKSGIRREDLFITSRVSNFAQRTKNVRKELFETLEKLHTDYVDLYQFHWPVTGFYVDTWLEMVKLYQEGYCRCLGVANCHQHHIEEILKISKIVPAVNQIEVHPLFSQKELINYCTKKGIVVEAYTAIARCDDRLMRLPLLKNIAKKYNKTVAQIVLRWHIQRGVVPIVRSLNKKRQLENISIFDFALTNEEMEFINSININSRLRYDPDNCDFSIL